MEFKYDNEKSTVSVYTDADGASLPVVVTVENPNEQGVDDEPESWYDLVNVPQWIIDGIVQELRPVIDAVTSKY